MPAPGVKVSTLMPQLYWCDFTPASGAVSKHPDTHTVETTFFPFAYLNDVANSATVFRRYRTDHARLLGSPIFWQAFRACQRAYLIDAYFNQECYATLVATLDASPLNDEPYGRRVVIFTEQTIDERIAEPAERAFTYLRDDIRVYRFCNAGLSSSKDVKVSFHDRIALLDGTIWHCGGTIGGMHPQIGALSGGWPDEGGCLQNFIDRLLDQARKSVHAGDRD